MWRALLCSCCGLVSRKGSRLQQRLVFADDVSYKNAFQALQNTFSDHPLVLTLRLTRLFTTRPIDQMILSLSSQLEDGVNVYHLETLTCTNCDSRRLRVSWWRVPVVILRRLLNVLPLLLRILRATIRRGDQGGRTNDQGDTRCIWQGQGRGQMRWKNHVLKL
jgi:hypothetical protein